MTAVLSFAVKYGPQFATWILANRKSLGELYPQLLEPMLDKLQSGTTLDRVGPVLAEIHNDQSRAFALLHQHSQQLRDLGTATATIAGGVGVVSLLSSVGLGVSVLSQVHLAWQFHRLSIWLKRIENGVHELRDMNLANLQGAGYAGLGNFKAALEVKHTDPELSRSLLAAGSQSLTLVSAQYRAHLESHIGKSNPTVKAVFAQNLLVTTLGDVAVKIEQQQPKLALQALTSILDPLRHYARAVVQRTILEKPEQFLSPGLAQHGVTLETLAELYRHAHQAHVMDEGKHLTSSEMFEKFRGRWSSDPTFGAARKLQRLHEEFREACEAIELVNQVLGVGLLIQDYHRADRSLSELSAQIQQLIAARNPQENDCFAVFAERNV